MADTGMDFGQSSQEKYSLRPFLNKQETPIPIAHDMAQAIQVADNAFKAYKGAEDEANQHKYFNATIDFNNLSAQQQDEMLLAGNDLNAKRAVLDKYRPQMEGLTSKYELNDTYTAKLGSSIESHNSHKEEAYRGEYNAQLKAVSKSNVAMAIAAGETDFASLAGYYKSESGLDDRTISSDIASMYTETKFSGIDRDNITWEQAHILKDEVRNTLLSYDNKLVTDTKFNNSIAFMDTVIGETKKDEVAKIKMLLESDKSESTFNKALSTFKDRNIIDDTEFAYYSEVFREKRLNKLYSATQREEAISNDAAKMVKFKTAYTEDLVNNVTKEVAKEVKAGRLNEEQGNFIIREAEHTAKTQLKIVEKAQTKEAVGYLDSKNSIRTADGTLVQPTTYETYRRRMSDDGSLNEQAQKDIEAYTIRFDSQTRPEGFENKTALSYYNQEAAKKVAGESIDREFSAFVAGQSKSLYGAVKIASNYSTFGNIANSFGASIETPAYYQTATAVVDQLKEQSRDWRKFIGEDSAALYEMIKFQTTKAGKQIPTPEIIELAKKTYKDPISQHDKEWQRVDNRLTELFNKEGVVADRDEYYRQAQNMYRVGMVGEIEKTLKEQIRFNRSDNPNIELKGYPTPVSTTLLNELDTAFKFEKDTSAKGANYMVAWNNATKSIWLYSEGKTVGMDTGHKTVESYVRPIKQKMEEAKPKLPTKSPTYYTQTGEKRGLND